MNILLDILSAIVLSALVIFVVIQIVKLICWLGLVANCLAPTIVMLS